ncbi:MAG: Ketoisovalerate oxidoreductase subunit VorC [Candidatus Heimdallarchaeota archaeon LC_3]|nr:MAG: Ketoisovalerate oxidoreductase subunit VorC [Candidatus Heimdallarchaeota archaeon LC_3]
MSKITFQKPQLERKPLIEAQKIKDITKESTIIKIIQNQCKGCEICVYYCSEQILAMGDELNTKSYHYPYVIESKNEECSQCRLCERICPDLAIFLADNGSGVKT